MMILEPSLTVKSHQTQEVDGVLIHKLECQTSNGEFVNLAMSNEKFELFKKGSQ
jgi:hypothetical protein